MVHRIAIALDRPLIDCNQISNAMIAMRCAFDELQLIRGCTGIAIRIGVSELQWNVETTKLQSGSR